MMMSELLIYFLMIVIPILINVAFITLLERKILGLSHFRKGPNKTSFYGILQPMSEAVKLFTKKNMNLLSANMYMYLSSPIMAMSIALIMWSVFPLMETPINFSYSWLILLAIMSISIYPLIMSGWSSNSPFTIIGAIRGIAQIISYEVVIMVIILWINIMTSNPSIKTVMIFNKYFHIMTMIPIMFLLWMLSAVAETNRTPFDFAEAESELVSGFNTEYNSGLFALIFMAEYASIIFMSMISASLIMNYSSNLQFILTINLIAFTWIWIRATYPRHRYDLLMMMTWKSIMPLTILLIVFFSLMITMM